MNMWLGQRQVTLIGTIATEVDDRSRLQLTKMYISDCSCNCKFTHNI